MPEWWTYTLSDLQQFSRETYYRLFELHNVAIWPAQMAAVAAGLWIWMLLRRAGSPRGRLVAALLAACWLWIAIVFHAGRYATINRVAIAFAWGFAFQAALLVWTGVVRGGLVFDRHGDRIGRAGLGVFLFALAVQPFVGLLFGRGWRQVEIFGVAPDPTAVATLGVLLLATGRVRWELIAIPAVWCAISGATLLAMKAPDAWIMFAAVALVASLAIRRTLARRRPPSQRGEIMSRRAKECPRPGIQRGAVDRSERSFGTTSSEPRPETERSRE